MSNHVSATIYAQIEPEWGWAARLEDRPVTGARVSRTTQRRPTSPVGGTVLIKLTLRIPTAAFLPLQPSAVIVIPEDMTHAEPIEVTAEDPRPDGES